MHWTEKEKNSRTRIHSREEHEFKMKSQIEGQYDPVLKINRMIGCFLSLLR